MSATTALLVFFGGWIAVGSRGRGASKLLVGSTASRLARNTPVPVLIVGGAGSSSGAPEPGDRERVAGGLR
ncbi:MAG TPA: universal stress protein [Acidimicrobiia bacterium]